MTLKLTEVQDLFLNKTDLTSNFVESVVNDSLLDLDDGEIFFENIEGESFAYDDQKLKTCVYSSSKGFGLRSVIGEATAYAHSSKLSKETLSNAANIAKSLKEYTKDIKVALSPKLKQVSNVPIYYPANNPIHTASLEKKLTTLSDIDSYVRSKSSITKQVSIRLNSKWQVVCIYRPNVGWIYDLRPLTVMVVNVILDKNGRCESGYQSKGLRMGYETFLETTFWKEIADEALRVASVNLESRDAPAGEFPVILGNGMPGVLLHEAVGHGLEGDFNRKNISAFSSKIGQQVASPGVTVVDNGTIKDSQGSINIDDEGTTSSRTVLIEDGILKSYMHDRMSSRLMNLPLTGNGRRESYADLPMPRMTNTYMESGNATIDDMIKSVSNGVYAVSFGGGQVDITSGNFVFEATEAYRIENGKVTYPLKGATLIGQGINVMSKVKAIGNDLHIHQGAGVCVKSGQRIPVADGQPSLLIESLTVGGTATA